MMLIYSILLEGAKLVRDVKTEVFSSASLKRFTNRK
jgi:hypothetical protein